MKRCHILTLYLFLSAGAMQALASESAAAPNSADTNSRGRYTFSWPLDAASPSPRGGSTRGAPVTLDTRDSEAWRALHTPGLNNFERDRRAVLALAGDYRVSFDFLEVASFKGNGERDRPYQSWGTERVFIDRDSGRFITLVHILDMRIVQPDGQISEPMVSKHWREDWEYEPAEVIEYAGRARWARRKLSRRERAHAWSQTVYQVDESPRYASFGAWQHTPAFSTWISGDTWRPLPTRELRTRKDYDVLAGTNRVTIRPSGWMQEENNLKTVLDTNRRIDAARPYVAREYGVAQYERLRDADFSAADLYYTRTRTFWGAVYDAWQGVFRRNAAVTLDAAPADSGAVDALFAHADQLAGEKAPERSAPDLIRAVLTQVSAQPSK